MAKGLISTSCPHFSLSKTKVSPGRAPSRNVPPGISTSPATPPSAFGNASLAPVSFGAGQPSVCLV